MAHSRILAAAINAKLAASVGEALRNADLRKRLAEVGLNPTGTTPAEFAAIIKADYERWGQVVKQSGFVAE